MQSQTPSEKGERQIRWLGAIDQESPTLGLPVLENISKQILYKAKSETGTYSHHGYITCHHNVLFAIWSNHAVDEDGSGQRVLYSISSDQAMSWCDFAELFPPQDVVKRRAEQDDERDRVAIANGFAVADDTLYAISEVHVIKDRQGLGRLARAVNADGALGPVFWLTGNPPEAKPGFPHYPDASDEKFANTAAAINEYLAQPEHFPSWEFVSQSTRPTAPDGHRLCEPTQAWRLGDGALVRLWRDLTKGSSCQYAQYSPDGGRNWREPVRADFPDAYSRAAAGNLPEGTAYVINNPGRGRDPLVISLAKDGLNFDRHAVITYGSPPKRFKGRAKDTGYQYPRAAVAGNMLHVIYSINKEDIEVAAIPVEVLRQIKQSY